MDPPGRPELDEARHGAVFERGVKLGALSIGELSETTSDITTTDMFQSKMKSRFIIVIIIVVVIIDRRLVVAGVKYGKIGFGMSVVLTTQHLRSGTLSLGSLCVGFGEAEDVFASKGFGAAKRMALIAGRTTVAHIATRTRVCGRVRVTHHAGDRSSRVVGVKKNVHR